MFEKKESYEQMKFLNEKKSNARRALLFLLPLIYAITFLFSSDAFAESTVNDAATNKPAWQPPALPPSQKYDAIRPLTYNGHLYMPVNKILSRITDLQYMGKACNHIFLMRYIHFFRIGASSGV
jgi:hypothetical protein